MLTLSSDPYTQQLQLQELINTSVRVYAELTSPVPVFTEGEIIIPQSAADLKRNQDYSPPPTRYAKFGNTRHGGFNFDN